MRTTAAVILVLVFAAAAGAQTSQPSSAAGVIHRAAAPASTSPPASSSSKSLADSTGTLRVVFSLTAVLALVVLMYWASRRVLPRHALAGETRAIQVLARAPVSPKHRVVLLQVGRRVLVVAEGSGPQPLNTLCEITDPDEAAALIGRVSGEQSAAGKSFATLLNSATERFRAAGEANPSAAEQPDALATTQQQLDDLTQRVRGLARHFERA